MVEREMLKEIHEFMESWEDSPQGTKRAFLRLQEYVARRNDVIFSFKARPGVSYSLRAYRQVQEQRRLFALVDVIDSDPLNRWLNVCFYDEMISDHEERGELIPLGLLGEDGYCFDLEEWDEVFLDYLEARLDEAHECALKGG
jgi:hypothetical protein